MSRTQGHFVVFEGLDGSGKSTQIKYLASRLRASAFTVYETFEPTDSPIGSLLHQMMTGRIRTHERTIAALFAADRIDHLLNEVNGIKEKVMSGMVVISDRYYFSSYAYHGVHMPIDWVIQMNSLSADMLKPDLNIFLDLPPEKCLARLEEERQHLELYEDLETLHRVRDKYLESFEILKNQETVEIVDADADPTEVAERVWSSVKRLFES